MKKLSKLMALLLSLLMILSLFAACGDEKKGDSKDDEKTASESKEELTGKDLLLGKWDVNAISTGDMPFDLQMQFTFKSDGTIKGYLSEADYNDMIEQLVEVVIEQFGVEANDKDAKNAIIEMYKEEMPYEEMASEFEDFGTWELDGDTLTLITASEDDVESEPMVIETELSKGVDTFKYSDGESEMTFKKAN